MGELTRSGVPRRGRDCGLHRPLPLPETHSGHCPDLSPPHFPAAWHSDPARATARDSLWEPCFCINSACLGALPMYADQGSP